MEDVSLDLVPMDASEFNDTITENTSVSKAQFTEAVSLPDISAPEDELSTYEIRNVVSIHSIKATPIVQCQETGQLFMINNITRSAIWADGYQFKSLRLSGAETTAFRTEIFDALAKNSTTAQYTWTIAGWHIYANIYLDAQNPLRIEFCFIYSRYGDFEMQTDTVTSQYTSWKSEYNFAADSNESEYYFAGFSGNFYFKYASGPNAGSEGGIAFYGGFALNGDVE